MKPQLRPDKPPLIAIVDDDESVRNSASMLVTSHGFRAEAFANGREFLESPIFDEVSCVILDVLMPEISGLELQRRLALSRPALPVIFITANAKERDEARAMAAGAVAMLGKPVTEGILLQAICSALRIKTVHDCGTKVSP